MFQSVYTFEFKNATKLSKDNLQIFTFEIFHEEKVEWCRIEVQPSQIHPSQ